MWNLHLEQLTNPTPSLNLNSEEASQSNTLSLSSQELISGTIYSPETIERKQDEIIEVIHCPVTKASQGISQPNPDLY